MSNISLLGLRSWISPVHELSAARDWYARLLGFAPYFDQPFYVGFDVGGYELGLLPAEEGHTPSASGPSTLWGVANIDEAVATALAAGASPLSPIEEVGGGIRTAAVLDPFGNRLGLIQNPHFQVPALGSVVVVDPPGALGAADGALAPREIVLERVVAAPRERVWSAWSTSKGLESWLADEVRLELRVGGPFEVLFYGPEREQRGSEGCKVLSFLPGRMLSFTWNAPPHLPYARRHFTWVVVELDDVEGGTRLRLTHTGWPAQGFGPEGHPEWRACFEYFGAAWVQVLDRLAEKLGPK